MSIKSSRCWRQNLKLLLAKNYRIMKKIEIKNERGIVKTLNKGRIVEGRLALETTEDGHKRIVFMPYNRVAKNRRKDITICQTESGWLKESAKRYKVFSSVKKGIPFDQVEEAMERDLCIAMDHLAVHMLAEAVRSEK